VLATSQAGRLDAEASPGHPRRPAAGNHARRGPGRLDAAGLLPSEPVRWRPPRGVVGLLLEIGRTDNVRPSSAEPSRVASWSTAHRAEPVEPWAQRAAVRL